MDRALNVCPVLDTRREPPYASRPGGFSVVQRLLRSVVSLGSRLSIVSIFVTTAFVLEECKKNAECALEDGECGAGGTGGTDPGFSCGDSVCSEAVVDGDCVAEFRCEGTKCKAVTLKPGYSDDPCQVNHCEAGEWEQTPRNVDDGDPCTEDGCSPGGGPYHVDICE